MAVLVLCPVEEVDDGWVVVFGYWEMGEDASGVPHGHFVECHLVGSGRGGAVCPDDVGVADCVV